MQLNGGTGPVMKFLLPSYGTKAILAPTSPTFAAELGRGNATPRIVPFHKDPIQAQADFDRWHKNNLFSPGGLLSGATAPMRQALLPFWLFDTTVQVHYKGKLSFLSSQLVDCSCSAAHKSGKELLSLRLDLAPQSCTDSSRAEKI